MVWWLQGRALRKIIDLERKLNAEKRTKNAIEMKLAVHCSASPSSASEPAAGLSELWGGDGSAGSDDAVDAGLDAPAPRFTCAGCGAPESAWWNFQQQQVRARCCCLWAELPASSGIVFSSLGGGPAGSPLVLP